MQNQNRNFSDQSRSAAPTYHAHAGQVALPQAPMFVGHSHSAASKGTATRRHEAGKRELPSLPSLATSFESPILLPSSGPTPSDSFFGTLKASTTPISNPNNRSDQKKFTAELSRGALSLPVAPLSSTATLPTSLPNRPSFHTSFRNPTSPDDVSPSALISPLRLLPAAIGSSFSLESQIIMTLCGEVITYDLELLEDSPQVIIHLLKATMCERGNWMTVGAQYRRKGNPAAALSVVTTMVEVLTKRGVPEDDLKPAFLMLSGCETDLGKKARASNGKQNEVSTEHYRKAQEWLQKVYGQQTPDTAPLAKSDTQNNPNQNRSHGTHIPSGPRHTAAPTSDSSAGDSAVIRVLEREIQYLRDRNARQTTTLNQACAAKCKLEDDLAREYSLRRKLQRQLDDAERARDWAQRSEKYAMEMLNREVDTRRRAEWANVESDRRWEAEKSAENVAVKLPSEGLADTFQRAIQEGTAENNRPFPPRAS